MKNSANYQRIVRAITLLTIASFLSLGAFSQVGRAQSKVEESLRDLNGKSDVRAPQRSDLRASHSATLIYVRSKSLLVGSAVVEEKLRKRTEFRLMGLMITREVEDADVILELRHDLFTMYVYTAIDPKTNIVIASGKLSSLGGTVAGKVAKRFLQELLRARQEGRI
jgi:hypothetical protein